METLPQTPAVSSLWSGYQPQPGAYDELQAGDGRVRPQWETFDNSMSHVGASEMHRRWEQSRQMVRDNRVSYTMFSGGKARQRPWPLDPFPLLLSEREWIGLEAALQQRARLLNLILNDLYGPQRLLAQRLLPPELLLGPSGLLRPCHGIRVPHNIYLHLYGADVGRAPDGTWCVFRDRTQSPTGPGYTLENRFIMSRTLPDVFRACHAERLSPFFRGWRDSLVQFAPPGCDNPRIVLLTGGPDSEAYFEHAYLARYLGYSLVQGADLTVRDGQVLLKTVSHLQPVDVILRRIDDSAADPLELSGGALNGVIGLLQAVRDGKVTVANALGSGTVQTVALMPFLPRLCRALLGEDLRMPSVPSWWCGDPESLAIVEERLSQLVIKPAYNTPGLEPAFGDRLTRKQRQELLRAIRYQPGMWVAQQQLNFSTLPFVVGNRLEPRHAVVRTFAYAGIDGSYTVLPGGMTRTSTAARSLMVSVHHGGGSKDTWVVTDAVPHATVATRPEPPVPIELRRSDGDMPSRVADALFWLGRYIERAEGMARILRCLLVRSMDRTDLEALPELPPLLKVLTGDHAPDLFADGEGAPWERLQAELLAISLHPRKSGSLKRWLHDIGRNSSRLRDRWSPDAWRVLTQIAEALHTSSGADIESSRLLLLLNRLVLHLAAFSGLVYENTTRNLELRVLDIGRRLERAVQMMELIESSLSYVGEAESAVLEALLEIGDSSITYRQRYLTGLNVTAVVDLLLTDESNPRSVAFQLHQLEKHIGRMPHNSDDANLPPEQRVMAACLSEVRLSNVEHLCNAVSDGRRPLLQRFCQRLLTNLPLLSDVISQRHFSHAPAPQQLDLRPSSS